MLAYNDERHDEAPAGHHGLCVAAILRALTVLFFLQGCGDELELSRFGVVPQAPSHGAIIDGQKSSAADYPATGVVLFSAGVGRHVLGDMLCSGTLIAPDVVLAAGHCHGRIIKSLKAPLDYYFSLALDVASFGPHVSALPDDAVRVASFCVHPDYYGYADAKKPRSSPNSDLALLFLAKPVVDAAPAALITRQQSHLLRIGQRVTIVGYGRRDGAFLDTTGVGVKYHAPSAISHVEPSELHIGMLPHHAVKCYGDSGGPTYLAVDAGSSRHEALIGITSRAVTYGSCGEGGVDTRVDSFLDWIDDSMAQACDDGRRPACQMRLAQKI